MTFEKYDEMVAQTAQFPGKGKGWLLYPALGLCGEAGEVAEKIKKLLRNEGKEHGPELSASERAELIKEIGDVIWYCSALAQSLNSSLKEIAQINSDKLLSRLERNVIKSKGDNR